MKKVLLIGKINDMLKNLHNELEKHFYVRFCSLNTESVIDMMKLVEPDVVVFSLVGTYEMNTAIFELFSEYYKDTPILTIGTEAEKQKFFWYYEKNIEVNENTEELREDKYIDNGNEVNGYNKFSHFENLLRPISNDEIIKAICRKIGMDFLEEEFKVEQKKDDHSKKQILIVDDNAMILRELKEMLQQDYDVVVANSGIKAMTVIGKARPDLILLDYGMPVINGKQTLEMIRADEDMKDIPVIFITGMNFKAEIEEVLSLKPDGYILKPPVKEKLLDIIDKTLYKVNL